jgi:DNA-binding transcriptional MocR family regulator
LQLGLPALDAFPRKIWSRLVARHARAFAPTDMAYPAPSGYLPLREAIAGYLATSRGVRCTAGQLLILMPLSRQSCRTSSCRAVVAGAGAIGLDRLLESGD